jgi:hypothetical protein
MIHWNTWKRQELKAQGKSDLAIGLAMFAQEQLCGAVSIQDYLKEREQIPRPGNTLTSFVKGEYVYVRFPSLKFERMGDLTATLSDPTGVLPVTLEYLWENSWITPESIQDGSRITLPVIGYAPHLQITGLTSFETPTASAKSKERSTLLDQLANAYSF